MRPPFSFLTSRLYSSKGSLGCVQRLNIYVKPTRQISFWQKQTRLKNEKYLENEHCTAKEVKTTYVSSNLFFYKDWGANINNMWYNTIPYREITG